MSLFTQNSCQTSLLLQKGHFMKTILNDKRKFTLYILFTVAILAFAILLFGSSFLSREVFNLVLVVDLICIMFFGSIIIHIRSGPPW